MRRTPEGARLSCRRPSRSFNPGAPKIGAPSGSTVPGEVTLVSIHAHFDPCAMGGWRDQPVRHQGSIPARIAGLRRHPRRPSPHCRFNPAPGVSQVRLATSVRTRHNTESQSTHRAYARCGLLSQSWYPNLTSFNPRTELTPSATHDLSALLATLIVSIHALSLRPVRQIRARRRICKSYFAVLREP